MPQIIGQSIIEYAVWKARALWSEKGIFSAPPKKEDRKLDENIKSIVIKFYEDDKYFMSVLVKNNMCKSKLLLVNLKELYSGFLKEHADITGFSKFYQMQPKCYVLLGASGTLCLCVCTHHQIMKLILDPLNLEYKDFLKFLARDPGNELLKWFR